MKTEFELTADKDGSFITFRHHDKDNSLEQKVLGYFLDEAKTKGIVIERAAQYCDRSAGVSHNTYQIRIDQSGKQVVSKGLSSEDIELATAHREACMEWETKMKEVLHADSVNDVVSKIKELQQQVIALLDEYSLIREYIGADDNESTFDEVQRLMQKKH